ncbi:MAG: cupin domain-containing protein [Thermodesulfobacteriota bacterium]
MAEDDYVYAYSSKDFGQTKSSLEVNVPKNLIHRNVTGGDLDGEFSEDRRHPVHVVDLPSRAISMTIGGLDPGKSTRKHRHTYETIIYILKGHGYSVVEGGRVEWQAGDAILVPRWAWHQHFNESDDYCEYIGAENAPMIQNLGLALREEE